MAGFLKGGPRPGSAPPKGVHGFMSHSSSNMPMPPHTPQLPIAPHGGGDGKQTTITHHPDGSHEVQHADGETSKHPNAGHMAAHMHAKHAGGEVGNMHSDGGAVTTHNVGPDGEVNGPTEYASPEEGANHLAMAMNGNDGEMPMAEEPDGDEGESYG
jgi:hypothetical protein